MATLANGYRIEFRTAACRFQTRYFEVHTRSDFRKNSIEIERVGEECLRVLVKVPHREGCMFKKHNKHTVFSFALPFDRADVRANRFAGFLFLINGSQFLFFSFHRNWSCYPWKLGLIQVLWRFGRKRPCLNTLILAKRVLRGMEPPQVK